MTRTKSKCGPKPPDYVEFTPDIFWGRILPEPLVLDRDLPFEERVERAWRHIKATRFYEHEHERLREVLAGLIAAEEEAMVSATSLPEVRKHENEGPIDE